MAKKNKPSSFRWSLLVLIALAILVPTAGIVAGMATYQSLTEKQKGTVRIIIPAGAGARAKKGDLRAAMPSVIKGRVGQTLLLVNRDSQAHQVGPFQVGAHSKLQVPLWRVGTYSGLCSLTPGGKVQLLILP
jgi:hypothetical protein